MDVKNWTIDQVHPYENNPRLNDDAVAQVAESINKFGWQQPIVVDSAGVIIVGHTRYKAAKKLGLHSVPVLVASNLTEDEANAYRLADNKTGELSTWDLPKLQTELVNVESVNMQRLGFVDNAEDGDDDATPLDDEDDEYNKFDSSAYLNLDYVDSDELEPTYGFPILRPCHYVPAKLQGFNYAKSNPDPTAAVHFFIDDYQFERLWRNPEQYLESVEQYQAALTPDFSLYTDMPKVMQMWNIYRARLLGNFWQSMGLEVIPTVSWSTPESFDFCFKGIQQGGTVALSTNGVRKTDESKQLFKQGATAMLEAIKPETVLLYGEPVDFDWGSVDVVQFKNDATERLKQLKK